MHRDNPMRNKRVCVACCSKDPRYKERFDTLVPFVPKQQLETFLGALRAATNSEATLLVALRAQHPRTWFGSLGPNEFGKSSFLGPLGAHTKKHIVFVGPSGPET